MHIKLITLVASQVWDYRKEVEVDFQCIYSVCCDVTNKFL